jgi:hypothetical protein
VARPAGDGPAPARSAQVALSWQAAALVPLA